MRDRKPVWSLIAAIIWILIMASGFFSCSTMRLERVMPKDVRDWYEQHDTIMDAYPPEDLGMAHRTERYIFLRLSPTQQREYIKMFWEIREVLAEDEYKLRLAVADQWFRGEGVDGYRTDRGYIMLLLGQPDYVEFRDQDGQLYIEGEEEWGYAGQAGRKWYQIWRYWHGFGLWQQLINITFVWGQDRTWQYVESTDSLVHSFIEYRRFRMAPTPDGWAIIRDRF